MYKFEYIYYVTKAYIDYIVLFEPLLYVTISCICVYEYSINASNYCCMENHSKRSTKQETKAKIEFNEKKKRKF